MSNSRKPADSQGQSDYLRGVPLPEFLSTALRTAKGALLPNVHNALLFLEGCPDLPNAFWFQWDEMAQRVVTGDDLHPLDDDDVTDCQRWLEQQGLRRIPEHTVRAVIRRVARTEERRFNPLQKWLRSLVWDRTPRLGKWLHLFLGTVDDDYHAQIGTLFLRSMVARAEWPGCKCDYMMVLEGPQRRLKSTVCRVLAHEPRYFSDNLPELSGDSVRISMQLKDKWLYEISEMHAFGRAEASRLKQFLSSQEEKYIPKYGRSEVTEPRTCVFIGTTNKYTYLLDETGGSRFWPVRCGKIQIEALRTWCPQLIAEAYWQVVVERKPWWPDPEFEEKVIGPIQDSRYQGDGWDSLVADWDFMIPRCDPNGRPLIGDEAGRDLVYPPYSIANIAFGAIGKHPSQFSKADEMRLAKTLDALGWHRAQRTNRGTPWLPPPGDAA